MFYHHDSDVMKPSRLLNKYRTQNMLNYATKYAIKYAIIFATSQISAKILATSQISAKIFAKIFATAQMFAKIVAKILATSQIFATIFAMCDVPSGPPQTGALSEYNCFTLRFCGSFELLLFLPPWVNPLKCYSPERVTESYYHR